MRLEILTCCADFPTHELSFYLMIASFTFFQRIIVIKSLFNLLLRVRIVDSFPLGCLLEALHPQDSNGISVSIVFRCLTITLGDYFKYVNEIVFPKSPHE